MKTNICILLLLALGLRLEAQPLARHDSLSPSLHLEKARKHRQAATSLVVVGSALLVTGVVIGTNSISENLLNPDQSEVNASAWLFLGGLAMDIASIPLFISASKHKRRAQSPEGQIGFSIPRPLEPQTVFSPQGAALTMQVRF